MVEPEDEFALVKMRIGTTGLRPMGIDRASAFVEEGARRSLEDMPLTDLIFFQVLGQELLCRKPQVRCEAFDIHWLQPRTYDFAAISAQPAIDSTGHVLIQSMNDGIQLFDGHITTLEKTPEGPVGVLSLSCQGLDPLDICFKNLVHILTVS